MRIRKVLKKAGKSIKKMGRDFGKSPLARAAKGKHPRGYI